VAAKAGGFAGLLEVGIGNRINQGVAVEFFPILAFCQQNYKVPATAVAEKSEGQIAGLWLFEFNSNQEIVVAVVVVHDSWVQA